MLTLLLISKSLHNHIKAQDQKTSTEQNKGTKHFLTVFFLGGGRGGGEGGVVDWRKSTNRISHIYADGRCSLK